MVGIPPPKTEESENFRPPNFEYQQNAPLSSTNSRFNSVEISIAFQAHEQKASTFIMAKPKCRRSCREDATSETREKRPTFRSSSSVC